MDADTKGQVPMVVINTHLFNILPVPGKGLGFIAKVPIIAGTRILSEPGLVLVPRAIVDIQHKLRAVRHQLAKAFQIERDGYYELNNVYPADLKPELGIFRTNGLSISDHGIMYGVFMNTSRINHACNSNAQYNWNNNLQMVTVHATRDIAQGQEITINYLGLW